MPARDPLMSIATLLKGCDDKPKIGVFEPTRDGIYPLWLASLFGLASDGLHEDLSSSHAPFFPIPAEDYVIDLLVNERTATTLLSPENLFTPFKLANLKLSLFWLRKAPLLQDLVLVAGKPSLISVFSTRFLDCVGLCCGCPVSG